LLNLSVMRYTLPLAEMSGVEISRNGFYGGLTNASTYRSPGWMPEDCLRFHATMGCCQPRRRGSSGVSTEKLPGMIFKMGWAEMGAAKATLPSGFLNFSMALRLTGKLVCYTPTLACTMFDIFATSCYSLKMHTPSRHTHMHGQLLSFSEAHSVPSWHVLAGSLPA